MDIPRLKLPVHSNGYFFEIEEYPDPCAFLGIFRSRLLSAQRSAKNKKLTTKRKCDNKKVSLRV